MKKLIFVTIFIFIAALLTFAQEKKVALIIGNNNYSDYFKKLETPENDAKSMSWALRKLGYDTTIVKFNLDREGMSQALEQFVQEAKNADVALFFYSGHGGSTEDQRYFLIPSGDYSSSRNITTRCLDFKDVELALKNTKANLQLAFIDACRSSIESKGYVEFNPKKIPQSKDGPIENNYYGRAIFFGSAESTAAFEGKGTRSIFTQAVLNHIFDYEQFSSVVWGKIVNEVAATGLQTPTRGNFSRNFTDFKFNKNKIQPNPYVANGYEYITISSQPTNAEIYINGKKKQNNPLTIAFDYDNTYSVEIKADGYFPYKSKITLSPSPYIQKEYNVHLTKKAPATLNLSCNVKSPEVVFDGKSSKNYTPPCTIKTIAGAHEVKIYKKHYYTERLNLNLKPGDNDEHITLRRETPWFFDWDYETTGVLSYHYSPKYQIGLSYIYGFDNHILCGTQMAFSTGIFAGFSLVSISSYSSGSTTTTITVTQEDGTKEVYENRHEYVDGRGLDYSSFVDPYNEAKHYDANALYLALFGYQPWNGIGFTLGIGAASHQDKYYMSNTYLINKNTFTNKSTGEITESDYYYTDLNSDAWYRTKNKWSFAMRIGAIINIPVSISKDWKITLGGGYTYLPTNHSFSSWDVSLGFTHPFD